MHRIKLEIAYDGTGYLGWQKTKEGPSIEASIETALSHILNHPVSLSASSRTDAGVHATAQVATFDTSKTIHDFKKLCLSLNALLPPDIVICNAQQVDENFHPSLDAIAKEYHYWVCTNFYQLPQHRRYSWHVHHSLNLESMSEAATILTGKHDFKSFCNKKKNEEYANHIREIFSIQIVPHEGSRLCIKIKGAHFLYKMARNIAGILVYIAMDKIKLIELSQILSAKERTSGGPTAPAHALFLHQIFYNS